MKLLFFSRVYPTACQPQNAPFNARICEALADRHQVHVIAPIGWVDELRYIRTHRKPAIHRQKLQHGITADFPRYYYTPKVFRRQSGRFLWCSVRNNVHQVVQQFKPEAVIGYWSHPDGEVALRIARKLGVPGIVMVGGSDVLLIAKQAGRGQQIASVLCNADAVVAVSEHLRRQIIALGVDARRVHIVRRGVDAETFTPGDKVAARRAIGLPLDRQILLWVGRMAPVKGVDVLIHACKLLRDRSADFHLCLAGYGELSGQLASQVSRLGLSDFVTFAGAVEHRSLPAWFRAADLTVLPSLSEGVPNVLLESLACGTPFVASRVGGIPEIADERIDRLVKPADPQALASAIEERLAAGPAIVNRGFFPKTWEESASALAAIIESCRRERSVSPPLRRAGVAGCDVSLHQQSLASPFRQFIRRGMAAALPRKLFVARGSALQPTVHLTFDDGPHPEYTLRLLEALRSAGIRATFFVVGRRAEEHPEIVRRIAAEGHAVANHTYSHREPGEVSAADLLAEVRRTAKIIKEQTGRSTRLFRPPHGKLTAAKCGRLWAAGHTIVLWNVDPKDFACSTAEELHQRITAQELKAGDIILLHDDRPLAAEIIPELARRCRNAGLEFGAL